MADSSASADLLRRLHDAEERAQVAERRAVALDALSERLAHARTPAAAAAVVTDFIHETLGGGVVALALAGRLPGRLVLVDARHVEADVAARFQSFPEDAPLVLAVAHRERRAIFFESLEALAETEPDLVASVAERGRHAGASLPLLVGERSLGAIAFAFGDARPIGADVRDLVSAIARQAAVALDRTDLLERARQKSARIRYLAHAGALLASTTETRETLATLARLAVPELADWAAVDLFIDERTVDRVAVAHVDPAKVALVEELAQRYPPQLDAPEGLGKLMRTGEPQLVPEIPPELVERSARDEEHLRVIQALGLRSYVCVPIVSRDQIRGAFTLIAAESGRIYGQDDLELALEIARRASIALDVADILADVRRAEKLAKRADQHKDEFLAMLGHELRNPLAAIAAAVEVMALEGEPPTSTSARAQKAIRRQVDHMKRMLDDLLDVARVARGKLSIEDDAVDLGRIVAETVEDHRADVDRAGLQLTAVETDSAIMVRGDRTRLAQLVANLVLNAVKFTPRGGEIDIRLDVEEGCAVLAIRDTGIGIEPGEIEELFNPFVQATRTHERSRAGLGLGLALVKGLATLHQGTVEAHSEGTGRGSTFTVRLPLARETEPVASVEPPPQGDTLDVLIVEDDPDGGDMLRMLVESLGHRVRLARNGREGLALARAQPPDLVLCDIGLPGDMDGYDVAEALRAEPTVREAVMIAVSGFGPPERAPRASAAAFDRYFTKPLSRSGLHEIFELAAERQRAS